jgi:hypothetical protein
MDRVHFGIPPVLTSLDVQEVVTSLRVTRLLIGAWCLLSTLEWLDNIEMFKTEGLLSWRILSLRSGLFFRSDWMRWISQERLVAWVLRIRIGAAIGLMMTPNLGWECIALLAIIVSSWFLTMRTWLGTDGADEIGQIASIGALLIAAGIAFQQAALSFAGTLLIAGQLTLSYSVGGLSKVLSAEWRQGRALVGVMGTHSYGHSLVARASSRSATFSICVCWLLILSETLFPLALFAPHSVLLPVLVGFLLFHASHAYFMGLNTFVWAFASAYPSFIVLNHQITRALAST